ncbi:TPA: hypothetical protein HA265_02340 [Candidatus Woesearchaeota archaeon]|nr:hypothetical protein [Candidatus Woesearchaeota archaeon]
MGVVRIDDSLEKEIGAFIKKEENRFRYPSKTAFLNVVIHEHLSSLKKQKKGKG